MEKISEEELHKLLKTGGRIREKEINISNIDLENINVARFENCNFTSPRIHFYKSTFYKNETVIKKTNIYFTSCSFNDLLIREISNLENLCFFQIKSAKNILIHHSNIGLFVFNKNDSINYNIELGSCVFGKDFNFTENTFVKYGKFQLHKNIFHEVAFISKNTFAYLVMWEQKFLSQLHFENKYNQGLSSDISSSEFKKTIINTSEFSNFTFKNCLFLEEFYFQNCKNLEETELKFIGCKFEKYSLFDNSKFNKFEILHSEFLEKASFENLETNYFIIHQVTFAEAAYFDDLNKNNNNVIKNWDRKTLRAIKRELQKAENRIDFNRFRAFELAAHYEELDWKWESGFIDKSILFVTKISTDFGNSWRKALRFTIVGGFLIYLFLYIIENRKFSIDILNWNNWERLLSGFFRFLLVTDFYNPLEADRIYLTDPLSWLILIFGKIFIAFGIYEMIQSFRKFKA